MASGLTGLSKTGQIGIENLMDRKSNHRGLGSPGEQFSKILNGQLETKGLENLSSSAGKLKFSAHAIERLRSRGITMNAETLAKLERGVEKAAEKGAKNSLVLMGDSALIVSVQNKTVITAVDSNAMKENVFTNIDSTVIL